MPKRRKKLKAKELLTNAEDETDEEEDGLLLAWDSNYPQMQEAANDPQALVGLMKACAEQQDLHTCSKLHAAVVRTGLLERNVLVGNTLVSMYARCGLLAKAQEVCSNLPLWNMVSWNALLSAYAQEGLGEQAMNCFLWIRMEGLFPDEVTFVCILKACGNMRATDMGQEIHAEILKEGLLEKFIVVGNALIDMYAKCGLLAKAQEICDKLPVRNVVSWNTLITGYSQYRLDELTFNCFECMQQECISPDAVTFVCILKACGSIGAPGKGQEMHSQIIGQGYLERHNILGNALVDMYAKCGMIAKAQEVFAQLPARDLVSWNVLIAGYVQLGHGVQSLSCFEWMQCQGIAPNIATFVCILKACSSNGVLDKGQEIHTEIVKKGLEKDTFVGTALIGMYAKCSLLAEAHEVFNNVLVRNVVLWNALITGYAQQGDGEQALNCFGWMQLMGFSPDAITFASALKACGNKEAVCKGQDIHAKIVREGLLERDVVIGTALVDMYANCGQLTTAQELFNKLPTWNIGAWNALTAGYALHGKADYVFYFFDKIVGDGIQPDLLTFTIMLNVCCQTGLLEKGQIYFEILSKGYGIIPTLEHLTCLVDLFGRAGSLHIAVAVIKEMPFSANLRIWHTVLGACRKWGNFKLGTLAFKHSVLLDAKDAPAYVCLSNVYAGICK